MVARSASTPLGTRYWFLAASVPLVAVDLSIMDVLLPDIVGALDLSIADASLVDAITVTVAGSLMVPAGKLADMIGAKRVLLAGLVVLGLASLATGAATGLGMLMAGRAAQGLAFAMILTTVLAMLNLEYPQGPVRARAFALFFATAIGALGLAPLVGAIIAEYGSWRWVFVLDALLAAVVVVGVYRTAPEAGPAESMRSLDVMGTALLVVAMGLILFAVQQGSRYGWWWSREGIEILGRPWPMAFSPTPIMLALGAAALIVFTLIERWREARGFDVLLDTRLFRRTSYAWGSLSIALTSSASLSALLVVSLYAEYVMGTGAIVAGLMTAPLGLAVLATGPISARFAVMPAKTASVIGVVGQLAAVATLIAAFSSEGRPLVVAAAMLLLGIAWAGGISVMTSLALADVPKELAGAAAGAQSSARYLISGFAMVVLTSLLIAVAAYSAQKASFIGLGAADRAQLDAVERLKRPPVPRVLADARSAAEREEFERYDAALSATRSAIDKGIDAAGITIAAMLMIALVAATRLPRSPSESP